MTIPAWGGRALTDIREHMAKYLPAPCAAQRSPRCLGTITTPEQMRVGHIQDRATHPQLTWEPSNWQLECAPCSDASGQGVRVAKAAHLAAQQARAAPRENTTPPAKTPEATLANRPTAERQVILVTGPPAAGKTTWAQATGLTVYDRDNYQSETAFLTAIAAIAHDDQAQAVVIRSGETQQAINTWITLTTATHHHHLNPGRDTCLTRARARGRNVANTIAAINTWFEANETDNTDHQPTNEPIFPTSPGGRKPPRLPVSLSGERSASSVGLREAIGSQEGLSGGKERLSGVVGSLGLGLGPEGLRSSSAASEGDPVPERLRWDPERIAEYEWLRPLLPVPPDANPPLAMTYPHPEATGTYGWAAIEWIESRRKIVLRWWQRLAIVMQMEHRADGSLTRRVVVESGTRRSGKSERLRSVALWRMEHGPELFEPDQVVVHIGRDLAICREVQERAWPWCEAEGWEVRRGNGKEAVTHPNRSRWLVKAKDAVYGFDGHAVMADECWDLAPSAISDGAEPAMLDRISPQLTLTSTAHPNATSLMPAKIAEAWEGADPEMLLLLWGVLTGADWSDPATWKAANAYWTPDREKTIGSKYREALAKAPTADDPDPVGSWAAQYLNVWPRKAKRLEPGSPVIVDEAWSALVSLVPAGVPVAVAVEGWPGEGISVAQAWRDGDQAVVSVVDVPDVAAAATVVSLSGFRGKVLVGSSMAEDPAWKTVRVEGQSGSVLAAVSDLARLLSDGVLRHDGGGHLAGQVLGLRTSPSASGLRIRSTGRADGVKAAVWAVQAARKPSPGRARILFA